MSLNLDNLKNSRDEVLKAEIGSLLFNLGKTHIGIGNWKNYFPNENSNFGSYKEYYQENHFENELIQISQNLKDFIFNTNISLNGETTKWVEYFKGDVSSSDTVKKVFFRGCENVNSGIDKGSPKEQLNSLWIANAFGSFIKELDTNSFDNKRRGFFENLHNFLDNNTFYDTPNWQEIRGFVLDELKKWYSNFLSDSRFPVNDVTLYDQAYMSATMFKASIAGTLLNTTQSQDYISNPQSIKWQILGVQYDKLSLAEKGLKPAHIIWYREQSQKVDNRVKNIIELEYTLGNEIYRDETGVYFLVPDGIENDFEHIKCQIKTIFKEIFSDEVYPYIGFTKASRGTMNLTSLLENAKKNFLKADYSLKSPLQNIDSAIGICQICQNRLVKEKEKDDETLMCDICRERKKGRVDKWLQNQDSETIWIDELADSNNRVTLVSLKFESMEWLNGGLLSSLLIRNEDFEVEKSNINQILKNMQKFYQNNSFAFYNSSNSNIQQFFKLFDNAIKTQFKLLVDRVNDIVSKSYDNIEREKSSLQIEIDSGSLSRNQLQNKNRQLNFLKQLPNLKSKYKYYINWHYISITMIFNENNGRFTLNGINQNKLKDYIAFYFIYEQLIGLFLERSIGDKWEEFIKNSLSDSEAIDFDKRKIIWNKLNDNDFELLSKLLLQFLLRKNPSPARLRRVWESTENFFNEVKEKILDNYLEQREKERFLKLIEDFPENRVDRLKEETQFKQYFSIIDPTPISWQFIIPTQKVDGFIKEVKNLYYQHFKYVNGKLPLHIGIVIQKAKDPLYVGIKALRNIRRDIKKWSEIKTNNFVFFQNYLDEIDNKIGFSNIYEKKNNTDNFYSLYETENFDYDFMLLPSSKGVKKYNSNDSFIIYPNTIDFEYLDTNTRRNDIYYKNGKRTIYLKQNRPYSWEEFKKFKEFKKQFKDKSNQLQSLVSLIYSKMEDWKKDEESFKIFMKTTFKQRDLKKGDFGMNDFSFDEVKKFLDMFEFWHTVLKIKEI